MIYFVSGLGADHRVFEFLNISFPYKHIVWVKPYKNDTLASYSRRLLPQINTSEEIILAGVSFGGMICQEIAKLIPCSKVIIISSIKSPQEMHWQLKLVRKTRIDRLFHSSLLKIMNFLTGPYYFGTQSTEEIKLLKAIIQDTDKQFMKWAINAIMKWENPDPCCNLIHIHGTDDRVFPPDNIKNYIPVKNGSHFMIVNRSTEINHIMMNYLRKTNSI